MSHKFARTHKGSHLLVLPDPLDEVGKEYLVSGWPLRLLATLLVWVAVRRRHTIT